MNRKIPLDAFDRYFAAGPTRSYKALAKEIGVSKRSITTLAVREGWQQRVQDLERKAREKTDSRIVESIEAMQTRHLRSLQAVHARALEALKTMPIDNAFDAVKALQVVIREERILRGDKSERDARSVEEITREEMQELLKRAPADEGD